MHKHWCEVTGHTYECSDNCTCECGLSTESGDHTHCRIELRPCPEHKSEQERLMREAAGNAAAAISGDEEESSCPHCDCGCDQIASGAGVAFCLWCDHVYTDYNAESEDDHFAHHCPNSPDELRDSARKRLAERRAQE